MTHEQTQTVDHGHEHKTVTVVVNGRHKEVAKTELTFDDVVALAYDPVPTDENTLFTISYRRGEGSKPEGKLIPGDTVKVKDGMVFNVSATVRS